MNDKTGYVKKSLFRSPFAKIARTTYTEGCIMEPHEHAETQISFILQGSNHERSEVTATHFGRPTEVIIKPKGLIHNNVFSNNCTIITIQLREENHSRLIKDGMLKEWRAISGPGCYQMLSSIVNCKTERTYYDSLNEILKHFSRIKERTITPPPAWILDVKQMLESSYSTTIENEAIGRTFEKHPVYIARIFKKYFGMSMKTYVKLLRTNAAMSAIVSDEDILAGIAVNHGFSDQSHLNRTLKEASGFTPDEFRRFVS